MGPRSVQSHFHLTLKELATFCQQHSDEGDNLVGQDASGRLVTKPASLASYLGSFVIVQSETETLMKELKNIERRYCQIDCLITKEESIAQRKVRSHPPKNLSVSQVQEYAQGLLADPASVLLEAETELLHYLQTKQDLDLDEQAIREKIDQLWTVLKHTLPTLPSRDAYLRRLRSSMGKAMSDGASAEYIIGVQYLLELCQTDTATAQSELSSPSAPDTNQQTATRSLTNPPGIHESKLTHTEFELYSHLVEKGAPDVNQKKLDALLNEFSQALNDSKLDPEQRDIYIRSVRAQIADISYGNFENTHGDRNYIQKKLFDLYGGEEIAFLKRPGDTATKIKTAEEPPATAQSESEALLHNLPVSGQPDLQPATDGNDSEEEHGTPPSVTPQLSSGSSSDDEYFDSTDTPTHLLSETSIQFVLQSIARGGKPRDDDTLSIDSDQFYDNFLEEVQSENLGEDEYNQLSVFATQSRAALEEPETTTFELLPEATLLPQDISAVAPVESVDHQQTEAVWREKFRSRYGFSLDTLPNYEQRSLAVALYNCASEHRASPTQSQLDSALEAHKSAIETALPGSIDALRNLLGRPFYPTSNIEEQLIELKPSLKLDDETFNRLKMIVVFSIKEAIPALHQSPYDNGRNPSDEVQRLDNLINHMEEKIEPYIEELQQKVMGGEHPASDLILSLTLSELTNLKGKLATRRRVMVNLIDNDFSHDRQFKLATERLYRAATVAVEKKLDEVSNRPTRNETKKQRKIETLQQLKNELKSRLEQEESRPVKQQLINNMVGELHNTRDTIIKQLAANNISKSLYDNALEQTLNEQPWQPISKKYVLAHQGEYRNYQVDNLPAGAISLSAPNGEHQAKLNMDGRNDDAFGLERGGRSSMSPKEKQHAINSWVVRVSDEEGRPVMSKVRTGVPVSFPMFAAQDSDQEIIEVTMSRMRETLALMVLNRYAETPEFWQAVENGTTLDFTALHTSLLSPDWIRTTINKRIGLLGAKVQKRVASKLDDEAVMNQYIQQAIEQLSLQSPTTIKFLDDNGIPRSVNINYRGLLFSCPANGMGQKGVYDIWKQADPINLKTAVELFGGSDPTVPLTGLTGQFLCQEGHSRESKNLVIHAARQIQYILHNKLHHNDQEKALEMAGLLNLLGQHIVDGYHDFCKSGKDRTGYVNQYCIELATQTDATGTGKILPLDYPVSNERRFNSQSALVTTGQPEIVSQCLGITGMKIDQGDGRSGSNYHRVHFNSKEHADK